MSLKKALAIVLVTTAGFTLLGSVIGAALGQWAPGYYRVMFPAADHPDFPTVQVGVGLGLTQGLAAGVLVGLIVVALLIWNDRSPAEVYPSDAPQQRQKPRWALRALWGIVLSAVFGVLVIASFILGAIIGEHGRYLQAGTEAMQVLEPILRDPRFADVTAAPTSTGKIQLSGHVADEQIRDELLDALQHGFGDATAASMIESVTVRE